MFEFWFLFFTSFLLTFRVMPRTISRLRKSEYVVFDMYKFDKPNIPTNAGAIIFFTAFICINILPLVMRLTNIVTNINIEIYDLSETHLALLLVISIYGLYGLVDDLIDVGRKLKLVLPISFAYPLISVIDVGELTIPLYGMINLDSIAIYEITWSDIFRIIVIPIYVMVVANLVNMHSGYNGLQSGLSIIVLSTLALKSQIDGRLEHIIPVGSVLGSMFAFWFFNKYPSKIFEGNIGSLLFGSTIGCVIVIQKYWWFGFFILIPHTFNFILWVIWLILMRKNPDKYLIENTHQKFGNVNSEGHIQVPNSLTLKWIPNYYFNLSEKSTVNIMYIITILFCLLGVLFF